MLAVSQAALSVQMTTADLMSICNRDESACAMYILGVTEGASLAAGIAKDTAHFCIPEGVTAAEMKLTFERVVREDVKRFHEDLNMPAASMVGATMLHQFPCKGE